jgi:hypothetical protein
MKATMQEKEAVLTAKKHHLFSLLQQRTIGFFP